MIIVRLLMMLLIVAGAHASAQSSSMSAEALGAKAFLEDLLSRRFTQELSTKVDRQLFSIGAQLDLRQLPPQVIKAPEPAVGEQEPLSDLMLGTLDPEALIKKYTPVEQKAQAQGFLTNFRIKTVNVSVGLRDDLGEAFKGEVEKWLADRLKSEFGSAGKGAVTFIKMAPAERPVEKPPKSPLEWLSEFQQLAGQLALALAIVFGVLMWKVLTSKSFANVAKSGDGSTINVGAGGAGGEAGAGESAERERILKEKEEEERLSALKDIEQVTSRLKTLIPKVANDLEAVIRSWCQMGEGGRFKLACFIEAVGQDVGRMPIPIDAIPEVTKMFNRMNEVKLPEKRDALQKVYWDLMSAMNLGAETLSQPFGYMGSLNVGVINQVLMDQNPKLKTLVSLFLPTDLRNRYVGNLSAEAKRELLENAATLSEIPAAELKSLDGSLAGKLKPQNDGDNVTLDMTLNKLVAALTPMEEATLLHGMTGAALDSFKKSVASVAFLDEWPDDKLQVLLSRVSADEVVAFIRVRPDLQEKFLRLAPPLTSEMASDELRIEDRMSEVDKNAWIGQLAKRVQEMVTLQEVQLDKVFASSGNGTGLKPVPDNENSKAA